MTKPKFRMSADDHMARMVFLIPRGKHLYVLGDLLQVVYKHFEDCTYWKKMPKWVTDSARI
jgi:hypothetical protein